METKHINFFTDLLGSDNAYFDKAHKLAYCYDATRKRYEPDGVLFPRNEDDVSKILKYCNDNKIIIIPRGAGSGFTGGSLAHNGGVVLAFEKHMNKILEIDMENMVAVVQPGVINMDLQKAAMEKGLFYPPDPASENYSTLGGNVAENSGGMRAAKYGITKDYVMALRAVLPNGDIIRAGKRTIKDVAGYNVAGILIASEGSLAVITEITLKLLSKPKFKKTAMGVFPSVEAAMNAVYKTMAAGVTPVAMEFLDNLSIKAVEQKFNKGLPVNAGAILITDVDGNLQEQIEQDLGVIERVFKENGANELQNGMRKFDEEGIQKIYSIVNNNVRDLQSRVEKLRELSNEYNSFTNIDENAKGNVKFIMMIDSLRKQEEKKEQAILSTEIKKEEE